ncbi:amidohydrolase family protein [uncultured Pluralibacter sp.]|uniref:N-acetylglucosamine-6-phosphate deacetylase n=1 Tax=uncultured Pluralibacter sp. TaxID=1490864 RepID=UPI00261CDCCE|nr:amidohydrolase family protein [uncultured Pluralibacter sp.]
MSKQTITGRLPESGESVELELEAGRIVAMRPGPAEETRYISGGLVDLQVNGYFGHDINAGTLQVEEVSALCRALLKEGVTAFLPTIITSSPEKILCALRAISAARQQDGIAKAMIFGVHLEGPSISPQDGPRGAHPAEHIRPPDLAEFARWQQASGNLVKLVTLSPHFPECGRYIRALVQQGVRVSLGHTHSSHQQIVDAVEAGASLSTHLGNGAHGMLPRHPNYIWSQLAEERLMAMLIADGHHLSNEVLTVMVRAKGVENVILVSDTAMAGGLPPGDYDTPVGGKVTLEPDGRLGLTGSPYLAGAALPLRFGVGRCTGLPGMSLASTLKMAVANPARLLNKTYGTAPGSVADLIRFRWMPGHGALEIEQTWLGGHPQL